MTEQRYRAVVEVQSGLAVTEVADRFGVSRQAVHRWLRWYADAGLDGLADGSHRPRSHPAQTSSEVEARVCELRRAHPRWGQHRLQFELSRLGCPGPVPSVSTLYRILVRHGLIDPVSRRRKRDDYRRWERSRPMVLWQMDIVGGVQLVNGGEAKVVTGVDDHSRFCVIAQWCPKPPAGPFASPSPRRWLSTASRRNCGRITVSSSRPGSVEAERRCSTGSAGRTASLTGSLNPVPRPRPGRSKGSI